MKSHVLRRPGTVIARRSGDAVLPSLCRVMGWAICIIGNALFELMQPW